MSAWFLNSELSTCLKLKIFLSSSFNLMLCVNVTFTCCSLAFIQNATGPSSVCEGSDVTLQCVIIFTSSGGVVTVQPTVWRRNGMEVIETVNSSGTFYIPNHSQLVDPVTGVQSDLVITNVRLEDDNTNYSCSAANTDITSFVMLNVIGIYIRANYVPYSGKFSKGLIFENFEISQTFSKIFFRN